MPLPSAARHDDGGCSVNLPSHDWSKSSLVSPNTSWHNARYTFARVFDYPGFKKLLLCSLPGCSSQWMRGFSNAVLAAMSHNESASRYPINVEMRDLKHAAPLIRALEAMRSDSVRAIACSSRWLRVAIVRNPYSRLLSKFIDKIVKESAGKPPREFEYRPWRRADGKNFSTFVQRLVATASDERAFPLPEAAYVNGHFRSMSNFCGMRYIPYAFLQLENLHEEAPRLARRLGVDGHPSVQASLSELRPYNACATALTLRAHYTDAATVAHVRGYFAEDFRRFGYDARTFPSVEAACSSGGGAAPAAAPCTNIGHCAT